MNTSLDNLVIESIIPHFVISDFRRNVSSDNLCVSRIRDLRIGTSDYVMFLAILHEFCYYIRTSLLIVLENANIS